MIRATIDFVRGRRSGTLPDELCHIVVERHVSLGLQLVTANIPIPPQTTLPGLSIGGNQASVFPVSYTKDGMIDCVQVAVDTYIGGTGFATLEVTKFKRTDNVTPVTLAKLPQSFGFELTIGGKVYSADIFNTRQTTVIKNGRHLRETRYYKLLRDAELNPLLGVHLYLTQRCDGIVECRVRISNAHFSYGMGVYPKDLFFESLKFIVPGYDIYIPHARKDEKVDRGVYTIVDWKEFSNRQGAHERTFFLHSRSDGKMEAVSNLYGLGFPAGPCSWSKIRAHGGQKGLLGEWTQAYNNWSKKGLDAVREEAQKVVWNLISSRANGQPNDFVHLYQGQLGWHMPSGREQEGEPGGWEIWKISAINTVREAVLLSKLAHEHMIDRQNEFHYDMDGNPTTAAKWASNNRGEVPFDFRNNGGMTFPKLRYTRDGQGVLQRISNVRYNADNGCPHAQKVRNFERHDNEHGCRKTNHAKILVQFANDSMAREDLEVFAENTLLNYHLFPHKREEWSAGQTMKVLQELAEKNFHNGLGIDGRDFAWAFDTAIAHYVFADPKWRRRNQKAISAAARLLMTMEMPTGFHLRNGPSSHTGQVAISNGMPTKYDVLQMFEEINLLDVLFQLQVSVITDVRTCENIQNSITAAAETLLEPPVKLGGAHSWFVAVGPAGGGAAFQEVPSDGVTPTHAEAMHHFQIAVQAARCVEDNPSAGNPWMLKMLQLRQTYSRYSDLIDKTQAEARESWNDISHDAAHAWGEIQRLI